MKKYYSVRYLINKAKMKRLFYTCRAAMFYVANKILNDEVLAEEAVYKAFSASIPYVDFLISKNTTEPKGFLILMVKYTAFYLQKEDIPLDDLSQLFQSLPEKEIVCQDVLILIVLYKLKEKDIAKLLNVTNETAKELLQYAMSHNEAGSSDYDNDKTSIKTHDEIN